ncbi:MAG: hypothetical protein JRG82_12810 [Deltaproteobacteria bacterium]|nr:hypothetical protein [Deltaproteobacteria bacterium]
MLSFEITDLLGPTFVSEFGFYYASDPGTITTIFSADDQGPAAQVGAIDFVTGIVHDADAGVVESVFTPAAGPIGFVFSFDLDPAAPGGEQQTAFSQTALNGGLDLVGTYASLAIPLDTLITLEFEGDTFAIELTQGVEPIPEASSVISLCAGLLIVGMALLRQSATAEI